MHHIIRKPFMLLETVSMLYKYINRQMADQPKRRNLSAFDESYLRMRQKRAERIQQMIDTVCHDIKRDEPEFQRFFSTVECGCEHTCLAVILTFSFATVATEPDFRSQVEAICAVWQDIQKRGLWISNSSAVALLFSSAQDCPGDLIRQIKSLNYSSDFRIELIDTLMHFEDSLHRLADLIEPYAHRLEQIFRDDPQPWDEIWDYWEGETRDLPPKALLRMFNRESSEDEADETQLIVTLMNTNILATLDARNSIRVMPHNTMVIGSMISTRSVAVRTSAELDSVCPALKCLADRKRLEMLRYLAKERSYGLALAESIGMDPGHVSRNLGMMYNCGFIQQERGTLRTYYKANRQALHDFLMRVEEAIFS